jgi:hypothetical protein
MLTSKSTIQASNQVRLRYGLAFAPEPVVHLVHRRSWTAVKAHALLVLLAAIFLAFGGPSFTLYASGAFVAPAFLTLAYLEAKKAPLRITPISFYLFWNSFGLGFSAILMGSKVGKGEWINFSIAQIPPDDLAAGYVICLLGSLALHIGLQYMRPLQSRGDTVGRNPESVPFAGLVALWALGVVYLLKISWFSFLGNITHPLGWAALAALTLFVLVPRERMGVSKIAFGPLLFIGTIGLLVANMRSGSKAFIMFSFLPLIWMLLVRRDLRRWAAPMGIGLLLSYFGVVEPAVEQSRYELVQQGETPFAHLLNSFEAGFSSNGRADKLGLASTQLENFLSRQFEAVSAGYLVGEVRKDGYEWGETMSYAAYALIPRLLWPNKPNVSRGAWFTAYLGAAPREAEATSSTGISATGELYWNFGLLGVAVGMFGVGLLYGVLWRMAGSNPIGLLHMLLYVIVSIPCMIDMPEAVTVYAGILSQLLIFGALFHVLDVSRRKLRAR